MLSLLKRTLPKALTLYSSRLYSSRRYQASRRAHPGMWSQPTPQAGYVTDMFNLKKLTSAKKDGKDVLYVFCRLFLIRIYQRL